MCLEVFVWRSRSWWLGAGLWCWRIAIVVCDVGRRKISLLDRESNYVSKFIMVHNKNISPSKASDIGSKNGIYETKALAIVESIVHWRAVGNKVSDRQLSKLMTPIGFFPGRSLRANHHPF